MKLKELAQKCHANASKKGFWDFADRTEVEKVCEKLLLVHCEISEAVEVLRAEDDVEHPEFQEELADVMIRMLDLIGYLESAENDHVDLEEVIDWKMKKNAKRPRKHGKAF